MTAALVDPLTLGTVFQRQEQEGLRLAIKGRGIALLLLGIWLISTRADAPEHALNYALVLCVFGALGLLHYRVIGSPLDRPWVKYLFVLLDIVLLSGLIATQPLYAGLDLPQAIIFRAPFFPFYFVALGASTFSFSPGLVLWAGISGAAGWLGAFFYSIHDMTVTYEWSDIGRYPDTAHFVRYFFDPHFVGTAARIQESLALVLVALLIAIVMWRARTALRRQIHGEQERQLITTIFGQYVPPVIAAQLISDQGSLEPMEAEATILFADMANFTHLTETLGAKGVVDVLNSYFDTLTRIISEHNGIITQFQGDAILATFNVPVEDRQHARRAVEAARAILTTVASQHFAGQQIKARIGICTGQVIAGSIGGGGRQNYTVHGPTVNTAARLEGMNKDYQTQVLIAETTAVRCPDTHFIEVDTTQVRGGKAPLRIFTLSKT